MPGGEAEEQEHAEGGDEAGEEVGEGRADERLKEQGVERQGDELDAGEGEELTREGSALGVEDDTATAEELDGGARHQRGQIGETRREMQRLHQEREGREINQGRDAADADAGDEAPRQTCEARACRGVVGHDIVWSNPRADDKALQYQPSKPPCEAGFAPRRVGWTAGRARTGHEVGSRHVASPEAVDPDADFSQLRGHPHLLRRSLDHQLGDARSHGAHVAPLARRLPASGPDPR